MSGAGVGRLHARERAAAGGNRERFKLAGGRRLRAALTAALTAVAGQGLAVPAHAAGPWIEPAAGAVQQLVLTADRLSGLDDRGSYQPWVRPVGPGGIGDETGYSAALPHATAVAASGSRLLLDTADGVQVYDGGVHQTTLRGGLRAGSLSGPYYLAADGQVRRVDGTAYNVTAQALFGATAAWSDPVTGEVKVKVVTSGAAPRSVLVEGHRDLRVKGIWGDHLLLTGIDADDYQRVLAVDYTASPPLVRSLADSEPLAIGDGYALLRSPDPDTQEPRLQVWRFATGDPQVLASEPVTQVTTDGTSRIAYVSGSNLVAAELSDVPLGAVRSLGAVAPRTLVIATGAPKWKLAVDASKSLSEGTLLIKKGSTTVLTTAVPASDSGSVRWEWDGKVKGKTVAYGDYKWSLTMPAADDGGDLSLKDQPLKVTAAVLTAATPTITGVLRNGMTLTANEGAWKPTDAAEPVQFSYQWKRDKADIPGATSRAYLLGADDVGHKLTVKVTGTRAGYPQKSVTSAATGVIAGLPLMPTPAPRITTTSLKVDQQVNVQVDPWGPEPVELSYQWYRVSSSGTAYALPDSNTADLAVPGIAAGHRLKVRVTGKRHGYATKSVYSATTSAKVAKAEFVDPSDPTVVDPPHLGKPVSADPGYYPAGTSFKYQWYRQARSGNSYSAIYKAVKKSYTPTSYDLGRKLKVRITASRAGYVTISRTSAPSTEEVRKLTGVTPRLTDTTPAVGQELGVTEATSEEAWGPAGVAVTVNYGWYRVDSKGRSALVSTDRTYRVAAGDLGHTIKVKLVSDMEAWQNISHTSAASAKVVKGELVPGEVEIDATNPSYRIEAVTSGWEPDPESFTYQWFHDGVAVPGPAGTGRVLDAPDPGEYQVEATAHLDGYHDRTVKSAVVEVPAP